MGKTTPSLVLVLLIVALFLNGYNVEGATRGNQLKKYDDIYKSKKLRTCIDCLIVYNSAIIHPFLWPWHDEYCNGPDDHTSNSIARLDSSEASQHESSLP
jgi:hypothetical protein